MAVFVIYRYAVKPGRMADFMSKLGQANSPKFNSRAMPVSVRLLRSKVPGPETSQVAVMVEYDDMAAYGLRMAYEQSNREWQKLFEPTPDSPETLLSVEILEELMV